MIRHIVALDSKRGMAKDGGMPPWHLRQDEAYFTEKTLSYGGQVLMGKKTFIEALKEHPLSNRTNFVVTRNPAPIPGVTVVNDLLGFIAAWPESQDLWIIGGSEIFAQTLQQTDELYITEIEGEFDCDRFYPEYLEQFKLISRGDELEEHGIRYRFCVYAP